MSLATVMKVLKSLEERTRGRSEIPEVVDEQETSNKLNTQKCDNV